MHVEQFGSYPLKSTKDDEDDAAIERIEESNTTRLGLIRSEPAEEDDDAIERLGADAFERRLNEIIFAITTFPRESIPEDIPPKFCGMIENARKDQLTQSALKRAIAFSGGFDIDFAKDALKKRRRECGWDKRSCCASLCK